MKQVGATRHPWFIACDANTSPEDFEKSMWFENRLMFMETPKEASRCRSKSHKDEWMENFLRHCKSVWEATLHRWRWLKISSQGRIKQCLLWPRETRRCNNGMGRRCLRALLCYSGGTLPERSTLEKGSEEEEEKDSRERQVDALLPPEVPRPLGQGHVRSHAGWRPSMHFLEYERASWLYCFLTTLQEAYLPHTSGQEQRHHVSSRNAWER